MTDKTEKSTVLEEQAGEDLKPYYVKITVEQQKQFNTNTLFYVRSNIPEGAEFGQTVLNRFLLKYIETVLTEG